MWLKTYSMKHCELTCKWEEHPLLHDVQGSAPSWRAQQMVALWCPWYTLISSPVDIDHSLAVVSEDAANQTVGVEEW